MLVSDFATLYSDSVPMVRQLVFSVTGDYDSTEDILQDIYLAAWLRFRHSHHPNPMGWLMITARHKACDYLRRRIKSADYCYLADFSEEASVVKTGLYRDDANLDTVCEDAAPYGRLSPLLHPDELSLLIEHYEQRVEVSALARKHHISPSACHMRLHRARKKLKSVLPPVPDQHCP